MAEAPTMAMAPQLVLRANATLVASMELLALPWVELEALVDRELAANPALERAEPAHCLVCGARLAGGRCLDCAPPRRTAEAVPAEPPLAAEPSLADTLLEEVMLQLGRRERPVAAYLLGSLDNRGFLDADVDEVARALAVSPDDVRAVLTCIQQTAPPGVGAGDVRECLLLQLERTCTHLPEYALARGIVAHRLDELAHGRYGYVARAFGVERERVLAARDLIRTHLRPYPILPSPAPWSRPPPTAAPEVVIRAHAERPREYEVEVLERQRLAIAVSPAYEHVDRGALATAERMLVDSQLADARSFVRRLDRRWETIRVIVEHLVERQRGFVECGPRALEPLTRRQVADALGLHESTVGRAVGGRHALLPSRRVVSLSDFFGGAAAPRDALAAAVAAEPRPLSDAELSRVLAGGGISVSRRTVAKYRSQLGIPAHAQR